MTQPRISFIGVGMMGHGMARNLVAKGFPVTVLGHRNRAPVEDLVAAGAAEGANPKDVAERSDVVILCVTGSPQVEAIVYGEAGLLAAARSGLVVMDCSASPIPPSASSRTAPRRASPSWTRRSPAPPRRPPRAGST